MDNSRPTGDQVPFGDITNTTHGGNHTRSVLVPLHGEEIIPDRNECKRQMERDRYAAMSPEKGSERNKKSRHMYNMSNQENVDLENNMPSHSTDANINNEIYEDSDWLHRQSTSSNALQQLSDDMEPSSCIGGTNVVHGIDTEEDINTIFKMAHRS